MSKIRLHGSSSGYVELAPPAAGSSETITLPNSAGEVLLSDGSAASLTSLPAGQLTGTVVNGRLPTGSFIQIVTGSTTTAVENTTTSFADTGLSGSITMTDASNKVLVIISQVYRMANATGGQNGGSFRIYRNTTNLDSVPEYLYYHAGSGPTTKYDYGIHSRHILDTPGTGTHTYKTQTAAYGSGSTVYSQYGSGTSRITLVEIKA